MSIDESFLSPTFRLASVIKPPLGSTSRFQYLPSTSSIHILKASRAIHAASPFQGDAARPKGEQKERRGELG